MNFNPLLEWISELIDGLVILFILATVMNTNCFQPIEWSLTIIALSFGLFVKVVAGVTR
jgi:hypothetical protein